MTDPRQSRPTPAQMRFLRALALERGESFAMPETRAQASAEIRRLKRRRRTPAADVARERDDIRRDLAAGAGDAAVRPHELTGYGSTAAWSTDLRPVLVVSHDAKHGTLVDGTTAGDGAAEILKGYGLRWSHPLGRWQLPRSAGRPANARMLDALASALRVYGFEVELLAGE